MRIKQAIFVLASFAGLQLAFIAPAFAAEPFMVSEIEVVGLERISQGTVLNYLPVREGDTVNADDVRSSIRSLFRAGFFTDVQARRSGNTLIFVVQERPTIADFDISGNKEIKTEQLQEILRAQGLAPGRILDRSILDLVRTELIRQYHSRGKYNVIIDFLTEELPNNLVELDLVVREGEVSRIKDINFIGNTAFDEERLLEDMELTASHFWSWLTADDKYAREKLVGDLEVIKSLYLNRGYADFQVRNVVVSLSPDKQSVFVTIVLDEGEVYTVENSKILGNLIVPVEELRQLILLKPGETFSQAMAEAGAQFMGRRLEAEGYAFAKVTPVPQVDRENKTVEVVYQVDPGRRIAVRNVIFKGVPGTDDEVYRRQMRQFEGAWLSNARLERSKVRIERLPFVETVKSDTVEVPGEPDVVDVEYDIKERSAGEFQVGLGYAGSATGLVGNVAVSHANFLGSGERLQLDLQTTSFQKTFSLSHTDPYSTIDGITRSESLFYRESESLARGLEEFSTRSYGATMDFVYPVSEFSSVGWGITGSRNEIANSVPGSSQPLEDFITDPAHGDLTVFPISANQTIYELTYYEAGLSLRAGYDSRNRSIFATSGSKRSIQLLVTGAPGDIENYLVNTSWREFFPLGGGWTLTSKLDIGLVDTYGDSNALPPSRRLFAGGFDSLRGFRESYLGPIDEDTVDPATGLVIRQGTRRPIGGQFRTFIQNELLLPNFSADDPTTAPESVQFSLFLDAGNLYQTPSEFTFDTWRVSTGLAATFLTPVGALRFSFGIPLEYEEGDYLERIQFTIGSVF